MFRILCPGEDWEWWQTGDAWVLSRLGEYSVPHQRRLRTRSAFWLSNDMLRDVWDPPHFLKMLAERLWSLHSED